MSRARDWTHPETGVRVWFDAYAPATAAQIELLADVEGIDLDDILEGGAYGRLSQRQVLYRLNELSGLIPAHVIEVRRARRAEQAIEPVCRVCEKDQECEGRITRHHFVPRWLMLLLKDYESYAPRSRCTIPVCVGKHRDFHYRAEGMPSKSIVPYLTKIEKAFAEKLLTRLKEERPFVYEWILSGDEHSYEYQLLRDFSLGRLREGSTSSEQDHLERAISAAALSGS